eukprot:457143_1
MTWLFFDVDPPRAVMQDDLTKLWPSLIMCIIIYIIRYIVNYIFKERADRITQYKIDTAKPHWLNISNSSPNANNTSNDKPLNGTTPTTLTHKQSNKIISPINTLHEKEVNKLFNYASEINLTDTDENCDEVVFFEAISNSISHGTSEDEVLDFIEQNIFPSIRECVVKDGVMMLPGESLAIFELCNKKQTNELSNIIQSKMNELTFNGNIFSLKQLKTINIVNDKNVVDYLMGFGFEHGIKIKDNKTDEKHDKNGEK